MKLLSRSFVKIVALVVAAPTVLSAANVTWNGGINGTWDIGTLNWNGGAAAYANGDVVFFDDTATGTTTLTIAVGGVSPAGINANHSTKNYSIGGASLGGTGILTKSGTGVLTFTGANTFSGGSILSQGTLVTTNATGLGTGIVTLGDAGSGVANMQLTLSANVANNIVVSNNGTGTATILGTTQFEGHSGTITLNRAAIFEKNNTGTNDNWYSFGGAGISGTGPLTIKGGGGGTSAAAGGNRAVLGGNNTYSGGTTIESGMLQLGSNTAAGTGSVTLGNANTGTAVTQLRIGGNIANTIIVSATAPSSAAGIATYNNLQTLSGALQVGRAVTIHGAGDRLTWSGAGAVWSGSGDITISGGRVTHDGVANTWTGNMTINASSTFQPGNAATLTSANSVTVNGTFQINNVAQTINGLSGSGTVQNIVGGNTLTVGAGNATSAFSGNIINNSGTMTLVKTGTGTLTLSGATSTYTGGTTISGGTLAVTNSGALGTGAVTLNGGTLNTSVNLTNNIVLNNVAGNTIAPNDNYRLLSGQISGTGGFTVANGGGTPGLELNNAANNFAGNVTTNAATFLRLTNSEVLPNTASIVNNGNLRLDVTGGGTETIDGLSGTGSVWVPTSNSNMHSFVVGSNNATASYGGTIGASGQNNAFLSLTKTGTGNQTLTGTLFHTVGTTVNGGILTLAQGAAFPGSAAATGQFTAAHTLTVNSGATLRLNGNWVMGSGITHQINVNGGTLDFNGSDNYQGNIALTAGTITSSGGTYPWRTGNFGNGQITTNASATTSTISANLAFVGTVSAPRTIFTVADGASAVDLSFTGNIFDHPGFEGAMQLVKTGPGTMAMTNAKSWSGGTLLAQGALQVTTAGALGSGTITINDATTGSANTSLLATGAFTIANNIVVSNNGTGTVTIGTTSFNPGAVGTIFSGTLSLGKPTTLTGGNADRTTYTNVISGNVGTLTIAGDRRTTFEAANTFTGAVNITGTGTILQIGNGVGGAQTQLGAANALTVNAGNFFYLNLGNGGSVPVGSLAGGGTVQVHPSVTGTQRLIIGTDNTSTNFSGTMGNGGGVFALTKNGTGTQTLSGGGNASGGVTINGGTLKLQVNKGFNEGYFQNIDNVTYAINAGATLELAGSWVTRSNSTYNVNGGTISATNPGGDINYMNVINFDVAAGTISGAAGIRAGFFFNPTYTATATGSGSSITTSLRLFDQGAVTDAIIFNVADGAQADDLTVSGQIIADPSFGGLGLTKSGAGRLVLSNSSNNFNGVVSINGGILSVPHLAGGNTASALGAALGTSGNLQFNGGTLEYTGPTVSGINRAFTLNAGGGTISVTNAATNLTWTDAGGAGPIIGAGALTKTGPGTLTMAGANTFSGGSVLSQGTIQLANGAGLGTGTVTINDASTGSNNTSLLATGAFTVANNIVVSNNGTGTVTIGTTSFNPGPAGTLFSGTLSLAKPTTLTGGNFDRTTYTNVISGNVGTLTIAGDRRTTFEAANTFVGVVNITGTGTILQVGNAGGAAQTQLGAANALTVNSGNSFYLNLGGGGSVTAGSLAGGGTVQLHPGVGGTQTLIIGTDNTSTSFSGTMGNGGGVFALRKNGTGTQTLTGASTYSGGTTINGGRLLVNNTTGSGTGTGAITVGPGATLGGSGFITTTGLTVQSGGTLAPGNSPQNLTVSGPVVLSAGSLFGVEVGVNGVMTPGDGTNGTDLLTVNGTINVTGALLGGTWGGGPGNVFTGTFGPANMTWIINNDDGGPLDLITGTFANSELSPGLSGLFGTPAYFTSVGGQPFALFYNSQFGVTNAGGLSGGNDLLLIAIPEPSRALLVLFGLVPLLLRRRRGC